MIFTVLPSTLYLPSTPFPEKLPDDASPLKVALFSFATFLASETNVLGLFVVFMLKVRPPRLLDWLRKFEFFDRSKSLLCAERFCVDDAEAPYPARPLPCSSS